jgi:Rod binding domain-containing protein
MTDGISTLPDPAALTANFSGLSMKMGASGDIDKTAQDFEAVFATQLLQPMFEGINVDPSFGGGHGEEVMRSFLMQEYGKLLAKGDRLGIASQVKSEMLRAQEGRNTKDVATSRKAKDAYASANSATLLSQGAGNVSVQ